MKKKFYDMNQGRVLTKDAFCITVDRRSGDFHSAVSRWVLPGGKEMSTVMEAFKHAYRHESLPPRWLSDLKILGPAIGDPQWTLMQGTNSVGSMRRHPFANMRSRAL